MQKIVINKCYGGFGLSDEAVERLRELGYNKKVIEEDRDKEGFIGRKYYGYLDFRNDNRANPLLVQVVEELGIRANGSLADLKIVEIPDGIEWEIEEYDGIEWIAEKHRTWS